MAAIKNNQVHIVKYLLEKKVTTAPVSFSSTALHMAAERNHVECVRLLLQHRLVEIVKNHPFLVEQNLASIKYFIPYNSFGFCIDKWLTI